MIHHTWKEAILLKYEDSLNPSENREIKIILRVSQCPNETTQNNIWRTEN
jgi:hypothetical protein